MTGPQSKHARHPPDAKRIVLVWKVPLARSTADRRAAPGARISAMPVPGHSSRRSVQDAEAMRSALRRLATARTASGGLRADAAACRRPRDAGVRRRRSRLRPARPIECAESSCYSCGNRLPANVTLARRRKHPAKRRARSRPEAVCRLRANLGNEANRYEKSTPCHGEKPARSARVFSHLGPGPANLPIQPERARSVAVSRNALRATCGASTRRQGLRVSELRSTRLPIAAWTAV